jgi:hypothetical protein
MTDDCETPRAYRLLRLLRVALAVVAAALGVARAIATL